MTVGASVSITFHFLPTAAGENTDPAPAPIVGMHPDRLKMLCGSSAFAAPSREPTGPRTDGSGFASRTEQVQAFGRLRQPSAEPRKSWQERTNGSQSGIDSNETPPAPLAEDAEDECGGW